MSQLVTLLRTHLTGYLFQSQSSLITVGRNATRVCPALYVEPLTKDEILDRIKEAEKSKKRQKGREKRKACCQEY